MRTKMTRYERMNTDGIYAPESVKHRERGRLAVIDQLDEKTRRVVKKTEFRKVNMAESLNVYHVNDFALENLIAVGTPLTPCKLASSRFEMLEKLERVVSAEPAPITPIINSNNE